MKAAVHLKWLWTSLWIQRSIMFPALICTGASTGIYLLLPIWASRLLGSILPAAGNMALAKHLLLGLALFVGAALCSYGQVYLMTRLSHVMTSATRLQLYNHILSVSPRRARMFGGGELVSSLSNDLQLFLESGTQVVAVFGPSLIQFVILITAMFYYSWPLSLSVLILVSPMIWVTSHFGRRLHSVSHSSQNHLAVLMLDIAEMLSGLKEIKSSNRERDMAQRFEQRNQDTLLFHLRRERMSAFHPVAVSLAAGIGVTALMFISTLFLRHGIVSMPHLIAFLVCAGLAYSPLQMASHTLGRLIQFFTVRERFERILSIPPEAQGMKRIKPGILSGDIRFEEVSFSYGSGAFTIRGINLIIPPGQRVAIVGPSGGGKSTLLDFLPRFLVPDRGVIRIDGEDISSFRLSDLRSFIGEVLQEPILFSGSLLDNIRFAVPAASMDQALHAARAAHVEEFALRLPKRYDSQIEPGGGNLSLGQRQRIAIARVFLKNPPILLLDEPTSALDNESERLVNEALDQLFRDRTTLIIAHRLATVRSADRILVVENGRISADGTHEELYSQNSLYRRLCQEDLFVHKEEVPLKPV